MEQSWCLGWTDTRDGNKFPSCFGHYYFGLCNSMQHWVLGNILLLIKSIYGHSCGNLVSLSTRRHVFKISKSCLCTVSLIISSLLFSLFSFSGPRCWISIPGLIIFLVPPSYFLYLSFSSITKKCPQLYLYSLLNFCFDCFISNASSFIVFFNF